MVDLRGTFHLIAFMISNQEKEIDFIEFFLGLINLAKEMDMDFDPLYIMMDASDACFNAIKNILPEAKVLMCFFHVMKNIKANCEKPLTKDQYQKLKFDIGQIHYSVSKDDYFCKLKKFEVCCDQKGTSEVFKYMSKQWFYGNFSNWQIFNNPPGWANTNSNIESFNATIKRDYSLRRRYSVFGSVDIICTMIVYYSSHKKTFHITPKFDKDIKIYAKKCSIAKYTKISGDIFSYKDKFNINIRKRWCNCANFLKHAICGHILGYTYRYGYLDDECWFGEKYQNRATDFHYNMKRGAKKHKSGRYKKSEKALSDY